MKLKIVNINSCVTSKLPIIKKKLLYDNRISCRQFLTVHKRQCNLFTICSLFNNLLLLIMIIIIYSKKVSQILIPNYQASFFKFSQ